MGRKPKEYKYVKPNDGRRNNGRKRGESVKNPAISSTRVTKAKKDRISTYTLKAMKEVFGSEEEAWAELARQAKDSFAHMKLLFEYRYGRPDQVKEAAPKKIDINIKNLFAGTQQELPADNNTIDITTDEDTEDTGMASGTPSDESDLPDNQ